MSAERASVVSTKFTGPQWPKTSQKQKNFLETRHNSIFKYQSDKNDPRAGQAAACARVAHCCTNYTTSKEKGGGLF
jgi:hypothetical protein